MFFEACDIYNPVSTVLKYMCCNFDIFRMDIQNASTTSSKSNQLQNVHTARWESGNVTTQPLEINIRCHRVCRKRWYESHCQ